MHVFTRVRSVNYQGVIRDKSEPKAKLGYLIFQDRTKIFQRHFPNVRMRTNVFREETTADHKVEEY